MSLFITPSVARHEIARSFYRDVIAENDRYYVFVGKTDTWGTGDTPEDPEDTRAYFADAHNNMLLAKKVTPGPNDIVYMVHRYGWESGTVYTAYGDDVELYDYEEDAPKNFYVMTDEYNIYKCLFNNDGEPSTEKPTSTDPYNSAVEVLSDGYIWKFMYQVPVMDRLRFLTSEYIPVRNVSDGVNFDVNGVLESVVIQNAGAGYVDPYAIIEGDGYKPQPLVIDYASVGETYDYAIQYVGHYFETGDKVLYSKGSGAAFGGLTNNTVYYIIKVDADNFKIAASRTNAESNIAIPITAASGTNHRFILLGDEVEIVTDGFGSIAQVNIINSYRGYSTARITMYDADTAPLSGTEYLGTITTTTNSNVVLGVGTAFTTQLAENRTLVNKNNQIVGIVANITSNTQLELVAPAAVEINTGAYSSFAGSGFEGTVLLQPETANLINEQVVQSAIHGAVFRIDILAPGTDYSSSGTYITPYGDGDSLVVTPVVVDGEITQVTIDHPGKNYNRVRLAPSSTIGDDAEFYAHVGPQGGHGSNIARELLATTICIATTINTDNVDLFVDNDYRQVGLLKNPKQYSQIQDTDIGHFTQNTGTACFVIQVPAAQYDSYDPDDELVASNGALYRVVAKRYDIDADRYNIYLSYIEGDKEMSTSVLLNNSTNGALSLQVLGVTLPEFDKQTGTIIYLKNSEAIPRSAQQIETVKLFLQF